jgi:polyphosphate kinase
LYRVANVSKIVEALIQAKEAGKEVIVIIELKARFDEEHNIEWANRLEEAGCTLIFGLEHMKVHSKVCVIIEKDAHKTKLYTHIGTGNYNEQTARLYSDFHLITADQDIGQEALYFLQSIQMGNIERLNQPFTSILVAPYSLKQQLILDIQKEASTENGHIILKMNALTDKDIIDALYAASQAGVKIDLIIRGICCLVPGHEGLSENIRVISVIGRYLEHTRAFLFKQDGLWLTYLSSADLMTRNTEKRLELAVRVKDPAIKTQIRTILFSFLNPEINHYRLDEEGNYQGHRSDVDVQLKQYDFKAIPVKETSLWQKMKDRMRKHEG